jgi:response regulator of citrate/malate metabolism
VIRALIVEDDFRVARVHADFCEKVSGFSVVGVAPTAGEALKAVAELEPDIVLLDLYLPDAHGLDLLRRLRLQRRSPDVIVLTAARDLASVRSAMRGGALHYLIKPFEFETLRDRLLGYAQLHARAGAQGEIDQRDVDQLFGLMRRGSDSTVPLPKGHSPATASLVLEALEQGPGPLSAAEVAERIGVSRATAQRYLASLADARCVRLTPRFGSAGRPEHQYELDRG